MRTHFLVLFLILIVPILPVAGQQPSHTVIFDGNSAYSYLEGQCEFGPRPPGSQNLSDCRHFISTGLETLGWTVFLQNFTYLGTECSNIIAKWSVISDAPLLLGAHYDTRPLATSDTPENQSKPILGANDGASGVAVLLELARILPESSRDLVELAFFDAEDSGGINGWEWIRGSTHYVSELSESRKASIQAMILVDMVGDANLRLPKEGSSTDSLQNDVWDVANTLNYSQTFLNQAGSSILDDHSPFLEAGIPALDIIHIPFPWYWHTLEDTPDKCSAESLQKVGEVLETFIVQYDPESATYSPDPPSLLYGLMIALPLLIVTVIYIRRRR